MKKKLMSFLEKLSRDEMRTITGGYGTGDPLWCGETWYDCECTGGSNNGDGFGAYMATSGEFMGVQSQMCDSGHMTCSC